MKKILIADSISGEADSSTIVMSTLNAANWLQGLRDNHFYQCSIVLTEPFEAQKNKYLLSIPRVMKADGKISVNDRNLSEYSRNRAKELMNDLGLHGLYNNTEGYVMSKIQNYGNGSGSYKLHIGFKGKIDEDYLLKGDIVEKKPKVENCNVKPKACANCKCGRKEAYEKQNVDQLVKYISQGVTKSNCGNCYLGDAFRCASCPYKGLPAFKPGEKIELKLSEDVSSTAEQGKVQVKNGKVSLDLD